MSKFNYKFESVKKVKIALEKKTQKELTLIQMEIDKTNEQIEDLLNEKASQKNKIMSKKSLKVAELKFLSEFEIVIDTRINSSKNEILKLEKEKEKKFVELTKKVRETKMFEKLEEKHKIEHMRELARVEQIEIDDIATKKYIRNK